MCMIRGRIMATTQQRGKQQGTTKRAQSHGSGLMKAVQPSAELAAIVGHTPLPRTEITKRLWDYIKQHGLQRREGRKREVDRIVEQFQALFRQIDQDKKA